MHDYKEKVDLIDELNEKLTLSETENLAFKLELTKSKTKISSLQNDLEEKRKAIVSKKVETSDANLQTEQSADEGELKKATIKSMETAMYPNLSEPNSKELDTELKIIHHPDVQREEELIAFKEKYSKLVEEKLEVDKELSRLREDYQQYKNKSIIHLLLYLAPLIALVSYMFFYYIK